MAGEFNLEEELKGILSKRSSETPPEDPLQLKFWEANRNIVTNDVVNYGAMAYQYATLYVSILVHRLGNSPQESIDNILNNMRSSLEKAFGINQDE